MSKIVGSLKESVGTGVTYDMFSKVIKEVRCCGGDKLSLEMYKETGCYFREYICLFMKSISKAFGLLCLRACVCRT